ncbi:phosphoenolpyruvate-utilizing N-terminal domain-containing protein [Acetivibrio saccincola]|jgi:phosphotransferase system enzyme I (PtsI)|nr:phosphoenolpyruvate-utilizing N-terminal domain-containing protein [Acetivibrio saccincola]HQD28636.1 phosphoenolpyruvate-utilizing N-terminal domain-containing protein [Acetivibrio saccincola]
MIEEIFKGNAVSSGTAIGKLFIIKDTEFKIDEGNIEDIEIDNQITLLEVAICKTFIEIYDLKDGFRGILSEEENRIFDFYREVLDDKRAFLKR